MLLNAQLAYTLKRSWVIDDYIWDEKSVFSKFNGHLIPSRIPISALLSGATICDLEIRRFIVDSGPLAGGSFGPQTTDVPRAVSLHYFRIVCPSPTVVEIPPIASKLVNPTASEVIAAFVEKISSLEDKCIELGTVDVWPLDHAFVFSFQ
jgi:hypothetical protein